MYTAKNNAYSTLAGGITNVATSLTVQSGKGALFDVTTPVYTYATLEDASGNIEVIKVTARSTDTLTIVRAQDGTAARAWNSGDVIECRPCAAAMNDYAVGPQIDGSSAKTTPVDADTMGLIDSAASNVLKKVTWANIKATLKTYFDALYATISGFNMTGGINGKLTTVASAATPDIFTISVGNMVDYTGTETATGFVAAPQAGAERTLVCAGAAVFTAGANMLIDGVASGQNFTAAAGDKIIARAVTTTQFRLTPQKADGSIPGPVIFSGILSPSQITADQNDYSPTGLSTAGTLRLSTDASRNLTGLLAGAAGRIVALHNVGSQNLVLKGKSASSSAANRFALIGEITMVPDQVAILQYDATSSRWRVLTPGGNGSTGTPDATTSGTSRDFTGLPATARMIVLWGKGISTNGTAQYLLQLGDSGGIETSGYTGNTAGINFGGSGLSTAFRTDGISLFSTSTPAAADTHDFVVTLTQVDPSTNTWAWTLSCLQAANRTMWGNGQKATSAPLDRVRLTTVGGTDTFDAGMWNWASFN